MGKTRSNDVIKKQDLEVKGLVADDIEVGIIQGVDGGLSISSDEVEIETDTFYINADNAHIGGGLTLSTRGLTLYAQNDLETYVRSISIGGIGTMIYSLENSKPLWLAEKGETSLIDFEIDVVSGVSGNVYVQLESERITFTMTEGDTLADVALKMETAINDSTYYTAQRVDNIVSVISKNYIEESIEPEVTTDDGTVISADVSVYRYGSPFVFVDGAGTEVEVN